MTVQNSKFIYILFFLIFFGGFLAWGNANAACTGSSPTWTCSADSTSAQINSCISSASVGDTINVGSGTGTWNTTVAIDKGINLIGAGATNTIITTTAHPGIAYAPAVGSDDDPFRLSGFRFNKATGDNLPILQWGNDDNVATDVGNNKLTKGRVDHCIFNATSTVSPLVWMYPGNYGVFDNNTFNADTYAFRATEGGDWTGAGWQYWGWTPGTSDAVYIENNTFNYAASEDNVGTSSQGSHRWVFRYNTFNVNSSSYSLFDAHGNQTSFFGAVQISNLYGNKFVAGNNTGQVHGQRGGQSFVFFNDWQTTGNDPTFKVQEENADSNGNGPATNSITGQPQHVYNSYYFNNRVNTTGDLIELDINETVGDIPLANRDIWNQTDWESDGSAGVGCGASRPATCTTGAAYWETSQGNCSDLDGYTGVSATKIEGTLYRCSSTNTWTAYYTPYTYPHPLRGESDTIAPASPTGLAVS